MPVIVKNTTASVKNWGGRDYPATSNYTLQEIDRMRLLSDSLFLTDLSSGAAVVNDGVSDLSAALGALHLRGDGNEYRFNNASTVYVSTNIRDAIIESRTIAEGKARFAITTSFNGAIGNNQWLGYNELLPGDTVPILLPKACVLEDITWCFPSTYSLLGGIITITASVDGRFDLYKNGFASGNVVLQETFSNSGSKYRNNCNVSFNAGDIFVGRWVDLGDNPADMSITYYFRNI